MAGNWDSRQNPLAGFSLTVSTLLNLNTLITSGSPLDGFLLEADLLSIGVDDYEHASQ